jgi:ABC1 atypical kinase-like domain
LFTSLPTNNRLVWRSRRFFGTRIDTIADRALRKQVARNPLHVIAKMVFEDGFFHADPHPGNIIMIRPEDAGDPSVADTEVRWAIEHAPAEVREVLLQMPARQAGRVGWTRSSMRWMRLSAVEPCRRTPKITFWLSRTQAMLAAQRSVIRTNDISQHDGTRGGDHAGI